MTTTNNYILHQLQFLDGFQGQPHIQHVAIIKPLMFLMHGPLWLDLINSGKAAVDASA